MKIPCSGDDPEARLWAFGGGKGGVGKSLVTLQVASVLALQGQRVVLADGDLGAPNLHILAGLPSPPVRTLADFFKRDVESLEELLLDTAIPGLRLLPGARALPGLANPRSTQKDRLLRHLKGLEADIVLLDLGAGVSLHVLDLFVAASRKVLVLTPEPTAVHNALDFTRMALYRNLLNHLGRTASPYGEAVRRILASSLEGGAGERVGSIEQLFERLALEAPEGAEPLNELLRTFRVQLVANMASERQGRRIGDALLQACHRALSIEVTYAGHLAEDPEIARSSRAMRMLFADRSEGERWDEVCSIVLALQFGGGALAGSGAQGPEELPDEEPAAPAWSDSPEDDRVAPAVGRNENVTRGGEVYHVQTEDLGREKEALRTVVYLAGRVVHTERTSYARFREEGGPGITVQEMVLRQHRAAVERVQDGRLVDPA